MNTDSTSGVRRVLVRYQESGYDEARRSHLPRLDLKVRFIDLLIMARRFEDFKKASLPPTLFGSPAGREPADPSPDEDEDEDDADEAPSSRAARRWAAARERRAGLRPTSRDGR